eukprot:CCRYP_005321-RA/>CCRYP_005321-RA protein AED:0.32 eAED:0.32 QI:373/1/1/1/0.66/0.5/4/567/505
MRNVPDEQDSLESGLVLPFSHLDPTRKANAFRFDEVSSIQQSTIIAHQEQKVAPVAIQSDRAEHTPADRPDNRSGDANMAHHQHERVWRIRNVFIIIALLVFLGVVAAIGVGIVFALQDNPIGGRSGQADTITAAEYASTDDVSGESYGASSEPNDTVSADTSDEENISVAKEQNNAKENIPINIVNGNSTTSSPSSSPKSCIPLEIGIIFDKNAIETGWKVIEAAYNPVDKDATNNTRVVWQSDFYNAETYADKGWIFRKCLPPRMYTFIFTDTNGDGICCKHGDGLYVLSSEGNVIAVGGEMDKKQERVTFKLPFEAPEAVDTDKDGVEDRLGILMPYDSSGLEQGEDCEPFRLELKTDNSGLETTWELYEGDNTGNLIANGGPYGGNSYYNFEYCLASPNVYSFYIYDWASDGLCCFNGNGTYVLSSGENIILRSTGNFGAVNVTSFTLPIQPYPNKMTFSIPSVSPSLSSSFNPTFSQDAPSFLPTIHPGNDIQVKPTKDQ